ncbi:MAG TPA: hypothetical protein VM493_02605 [Vicinamibacterales bacterium]|nr:hypothetical protein [Vicinamibacterales bacterium]
MATSSRSTPIDYLLIPFQFFTGLPVELVDNIEGDVRAQQVVDGPPLFDLA